MASLLTIDGTAITEKCTSYAVPLSDLDSENSNRDELGIMHRDRLRQGMRKVQIAFTAISLSEASTILTLLKPDKVSAQYLDVESGAYKTSDMYVGDRTCNLSKHTDLNHPENSLWDVSFNLTEY